MVRDRANVALLQDEVHVRLHRDLRSSGSRCHRVVGIDTALAALCQETIRHHCGSHGY